MNNKEDVLIMVLAILVVIGYFLAAMWVIVRQVNCQEDKVETKESTHYGANGSWRLRLSLPDSKLFYFKRV